MKTPGKNVALTRARKIGAKETLTAVNSTRELIGLTPVETLKEAQTNEIIAALREVLANRHSRTIYRRGEYITRISADGIAAIQAATQP